MTHHLDPERDYQIFTDDLGDSFAVAIRPARPGVFLAVRTPMYNLSMEEAARLHTHLGDLIDRQKDRPTNEPWVPPGTQISDDGTTILPETGDQS